MGLAAIVLSAGASTRMGQPKQLLPIGNTPMIQHVFDTLSQVEFALKCCVTGAYRDQIASLVPDQVELIDNPHWQLGLGESIKAGIQYVSGRTDIDAAFLFLADQPFILASDLHRMITLHLEHPGYCVATSYDETPGVPAIFPETYFSALQQLPGHSGAKSLLTRSGTDVILYQHKGRIIDIDTIEDYNQN